MDRYLLDRFLMDEATEAEIDQINEWISGNAEHEKEFQKAYEAHVLMTLAVSKKEMKDEIEQSRRSRLYARIRKIVAYSASVAAAVAFGMFISWQFFTRPLEDDARHLMTFNTEAGQRASVTLPDGTVVKLNSGSVLEYPTVFSRKERRVKINGEAMFDVAKDAGKPFIVETFAYDVKVLGTKFNIIAEEQTGDFSTALLEGKVSVMDKSGMDRAILYPSQMASLEEGSLKLSTVRNIEEEHLWTEGILSVAGVPFDKLVQRMERCYGVKIVVEKDNMPSVRYRRMKVRISDGIEFALNAIQRESDFEWRYDDLTDTYYIY